MTIRYSQFLSYMDDVTDNNQTIIVSHKNNKNIVMISEEAYNNLMENLHIVKDKANYEWLMESKQQLEGGLAKSQMTFFQDFFS